MRGLEEREITAIKHAVRVFRRTRPQHFSVSVEDMTQAAALAVLRVRPRIKELSADEVGSYLYHTALGAIADEMRRARQFEGFTRAGKTSKVSFKDDEDLPDHVHLDTPENYLVAQQTVKAFDALPAEHRLVWEAVLAGYTHSEIAQQLGFTQTKVSWLASLAQRTVQKIVARLRRVD